MAMIFLSTAMLSWMQDIINWLPQFVPLSQINAIVTACTPTFQLIAILLLVLGAVQEIPKHQAEGVFMVIARAVVICAFIAYAPSWMYFGEVFAQNLSSTICSSTQSATGGGSGFIGVANTLSGVASVVTQPSLANTPILTNNPGSLASTSQGELMYDYSGLFEQLSNTVNLVSAGYSAVSQNNEPLWEKIVWGSSPLNDIYDLFSGKSVGSSPIPDVLGILFGYATVLLAAFSAFILEMLLLIQKAIVILSRLFMPAFLALLGWQGPTRFLGVNYIQSVIGVMSWPIGWSIVYMGAMAGITNVQTSLSQGVSSGSLDGIALFVNIALICLWISTGAVIAPMLMTRVVTAGGNFGAGMVGAVSGKALGMGGAMVGAAAGGAGTAAGAAIGAAVGGPPGAIMGASMGSSIGGGLGNAVSSQTFGNAQNAVAQATGADGGGGGGATPSRASSYAGMAALQGIAQMNQAPPPTG